MSEMDNGASGCYSVAAMFKSPSKAELKSNVSGSYYNSMDYSNHNFHSVNCNAKGDDNLDKNLALSMPTEIKLYKKRFVMLFLASFCSLMNGVPQFQYAVIADIVACYYGVTVDAADWTCIVYMVVFLPLVFPVMYFMDKKGLRYTVIIGGLLNCIGGWIQCFSLAPDRFVVIMLSQTIYAAGQVFLLSLPPFIAGVWFGANEVGLACALGVFGNQLGVATGFIIPPLLIDNNCTHQTDITREMTILSYPVAMINTAVLIILIIAFQEKPKIFPSLSQAAKANEAKELDYVKSLKNLSKDVPFVLLFIAYGLITGTYFSMSAILNQMVLIHFDDAEMDAGWMGAIMVFAGMIGSLILGTILDRTHKFKEISFLTFGVSFILAILYALIIILDTEMWVQFLFFGLLGFFTAGYLPVGFDFAAEITYPESEAMSGSLLNASCQAVHMDERVKARVPVKRLAVHGFLMGCSHNSCLDTEIILTAGVLSTALAAFMTLAIFSIIITVIASHLIQVYGDTASNIFFCGCLLLGTIITGCIKVELKRCNAAQSKAKDEKMCT